jgi:LmbE family N-acetylglucosaminyl deacetylase
MLQFDIILVLLMASAAIYCVRTRVPKPFSDRVRDVLICAAHYDDCVIMGAEYSYRALENGQSVTIAFLTCSGPNPEAEIACVRKAEALAAWSAVGIPEKNFTFLNLPESPVGGPLSYSDQDAAIAKKKLQFAILALPECAAIIIPAEGESHVDHRTARKVTLEAIVESQRKDLLVYETPEYNTFLSFFHSPRRTFWTMLRYVPLFNRIVGSYAGPPTYMDGGQGCVFRDTPSPLAVKKKLLGFFHSQNVALLIHHFGYATPYRRVSVSKTSRARVRRWRFVAFGCCCDASILAMGVGLLTVTWLTAYELASAFTVAAAPLIDARTGLVLLGVASASAYFVRRFRRTAALETSLFVWVAALGLIFGTLGSRIV